MLIRGLRSRRGVSLVELIVAITIGGVVLALVSSISVRQQRLYADIAARSALDAQLRQAKTILPIELRGVAASAGDIREARDTSIEVRATLSSAIVCDTQPGALVLAPADAHHTTFASYLTPIDVGDTAWLLVATDSVDYWRPLRVIQTAVATPGPCGHLGPRLPAGLLTASRTVVGFALPLPTEAAIGSVIRVTRPVRYSLYRGGDARWYLGQRDWNVLTSRFNTVQPVSGPFSSPSAHGLVFEYFDTSGVQLAVPVVNTKAIASIRASMRGQSSTVMRAFARGAQGKSADSARVAVALRNRR
jgi:prepilin-type N-terminal cleavage/methylation domain-containing protein